MKKILIADPIKETRDKLKRSLSSHGFPVAECANGAEVVVLNHDEIMMVLLAQNLQDMSAFETLAGVKRENPYFSEVPFIICTSDNSDAFYRKCLGVGFKGVLYRPFSRKALFDLVRNIMIEERIADEDMFGGEEQVEEINESERIEFLRHLLRMRTPLISPKYDPKVNVGYSYPLMTEFFALESGDEYDLLRTYREQNIFNQRLENRVNVCPRCSFHTINFREVCPRCHDLNIAVEEVFHHFTCGYVGPSSDFADVFNEQLICPKCSKQLRHIGLDYEKPANTYVCHACQYVFNDPLVNFNCFHCGYQGNSDELVISNIFSYTPGPKAMKIVENNSFNVVQLEDLIRQEERNCYSIDFFNFMLQRDFQSCRDYGDLLHVMIIGVKNSSPKLIDRIIEFVISRRRAAETVSVDVSGHVLMLLPRLSAEEAKNRAVKIRDYIAGIEHTPPYEPCIFLRPFDQHEQEEGANLLKNIIVSFERNYHELPPGIFVYSDESEPS